MELYTAIYETDDDDLMKPLSEINLSGISLSHDKAHVIGSLISRNGSLEYLNLRNCSIDDELLKIISRCLKNRCKMSKMPSLYIDQIDLGSNHFSAAACRLFLGYHKNEQQSANLQWRVIQMTIPNLESEQLISILTKDGGDLINIGGDHGVTGCFNPKESKLVFAVVHNLAIVAFYSVIFEAKNIEIPDGELYARQEDLRKLLTPKAGKIKELLYDCVEETSIDWSLIEAFVKKYQVKFLNIAVNGNVAIGECNVLSRHVNGTSGCGIHVSVHWISIAYQAEDIRFMIENFRQKEIGYIRCRLCYPASLNDITLLVTHSKKLTLILDDEKYRLSGYVLKKIEEISSQLCTELEVIHYENRDTGAWQIIDTRFQRKKSSSVCCRNGTGGTTGSSSRQEIDVAE